MSAPIIVISGPPGSGKTTVAALLAKQYARSVHLVGDHFFRYIVGDWKDPSTVESHEQNQLVVDITTRAACAYADAGYKTIFDGVVGPWFLDQVQGVIADRPLHYVILRADLETALDRALNRSETPAPEHVIRKVHEHFDELAQYEPFVVDTSTATPDQVTAQVLERIESGAARLTP